MKNPIDIDIDIVIVIYRENPYIIIIIIITSSWFPNQPWLYMIYGADYSHS